MKIRQGKSGFTIVELLIVIVIIGILATIIIVVYNGITKKAQDSVLQSDLKNASTTLEIANATDGSYPGDDSSLKSSPDTAFDYSYSSDDNSYCLEASSTKTTSVYHVTNGGMVTSGGCGVAIADGVNIQDITSANCPTTNKVRAVDARDNHTYWVQKLADGKCWMLTNLGYAGGGTNTYSDTKTLTNGTGGATTYTVAQYYVVPSTTNFTAEPTAPSTATNGTGQYGYLYNWCAAMGAPISTDPNPSSACANATTPTPNVNRSICPAGWRLPIGGSGAEFSALNSAVNNGSGSNDNGLRSTWLAQYGGDWISTTFYDQGTTGYYWSSTQSSATEGYSLYFLGTYVFPPFSYTKSIGMAVRCIAAV